MQKAVRCSPSTISGKELPGLAVSGLAAPLCSALLPCGNQEKERTKRKKKAGRKERKEESRKKQRCGDARPGRAQGTREKPAVVLGMVPAVPGSRASL